MNTAGEIKTDNIIRKALEDRKQVFIPWFAKGNPYMQMVELRNTDEFNELMPTLWDIRQFPTIDDRESYKKTGLIINPFVITIYF